MKNRLDSYLKEHHLLKSRSAAKDLIKRGFVKINQKVVKTPSYIFKEGDVIEITKKNKYVSRGADKLISFLENIEIELDNKIVIDVGSSKGGFTQVLLEKNVKKIYCVDVGTNQLDQTLIDEEKINLNEETNILNFDIPKNDLIVIDISFTSILPVLEYLFKKTNKVIALIKPQFEQKEKSKHIIKDEKESKLILDSVVSEIKNLGYNIIYVKKSSLKGKKGNQEYFCYLKTKNDKKS